MEPALEDRTGITNAGWEAKYNVADERLYALEEELDCLLYCSKQLRKQRQELVQSRIQYTDSSPYEQTVSNVDVNQLADQYLALYRKNQDIDDVAEKVKNDCRRARTECCSLFVRARSRNPNQPGSNEAAEDMFGQGGTMLAELMHQDMWGAMDSDFPCEVIRARWEVFHALSESAPSLCQRFLEIRTRIREIAAVIGILGAGTTYSTLLSANRGRLDLISWAFAAFVLLLVHGLLLQALEGPKSFSMFTLEHSSPALRRKQNLIHVIPLMALMFLGPILVILSVALCDPTVPPVAGSTIALQAAVYIPLGAFGGTIIIAINYITKAERKWPRGTESPQGFPSHLVPRDKRWRLLPGGDEYGMYRQRREKIVMVP